MRSETVEAGGKTCNVYINDGNGMAEEGFLLLQPGDEHDGSSFADQAEKVAELTGMPFTLCCMPVADWNRDLSPWEAPPVFGNEPFGCGAAATLALIEKEILPAFRYRECIIGGYSLAALFALWCVFETDSFQGAAAASPSVWFPGWTEYAAGRPCHALAASLSLGDKEMKTRNPVMRRVGDCMEETMTILGRVPGMRSEFEWNSGNHFRDADLRTAKVFAGCMKLLAGAGAQSPL